MTKLLAGAISKRAKWLSKVLAIGLLHFVPSHSLDGACLFELVPVLVIES
jgi:hypothetical protein